MENKENHHGGLQQQSLQRLVDENEHINRRHNRMILWLKPLQVV